MTKEDDAQQAAEAAALEAALKELSPRDQALLKQILQDAPGLSLAEALAQLLKQLRAAGM